MTCKVLLVQEMADFSNIATIATGLAIYCETGKYPDFLGHYGQFENNPMAQMSQINKVHIALCRQDWLLKGWQNNSGYKRTSDNFLIYAQHIFYDDYFQILAVVTPEAHKRIDSLLPQFIDKAEAFHRLERAELATMTYFCADSVLAKKINLTD